MSNADLKRWAVEFMRHFDMLEFAEKIDLSKDLDTRINNKTIVPNDIPTAKALSRWCTMNIMVGNQICPPTWDHLQSYI